MVERSMISLAHGPNEIASTIGAGRKTLGGTIVHYEDFNNVVTHR